jgi:hypothetical protein
VEVETPTMGVSRPIVTITSQEGAARPEPLTTQATASEAGQMGGDTVEASPVVAAM